MGAQEIAPRMAVEPLEKLRFPYEQGGLTFFIDAARVTAIQAEETDLFQGWGRSLVPSLAKASH